MAEQKFEKIPFRMHPRVFAALGADLVTNDVVAVIELVKNSYDAFARNVWIRFGDNGDGSTYLEIEDDGLGMDHDTIHEVWCVVATPNKESHRKVRRGNKARRVVGEKGLGRLSVSRLGEKLQILTQQKGEPCWELKVDWGELAKADELSKCNVLCREYTDETPFKSSGTILQVDSLNSVWDETRISDLQENLARLMSPFGDLGEFNIYLSLEDSSGVSEEEVHIQSPQFLSRPKYSLSGTVDELGNLDAKYKFKAIKHGKQRSRSFSISWNQIYDDIQDKRRADFSSEAATCGPFSFEIRAWDLGTEDTAEIAEKFDFQKSQIRKAISVHKGISVYRDGVLVLPKSEGARDWLGLDLRRVSKVGTRMSTSQLVGYVAITGDGNPDVLDTSDRERLVSNQAVIDFEEILKAAIGLLEIERDQDRVKKTEPVKSLFEGLSANSLVESISELADGGAEASEAVPLVAAFNASLETTRKAIEDRFIFYSRMATVGTIAQMLVHEIRNRTTVFGAFLDIVKSRFGPFDDEQLAKYYSLADSSVIAMERLADTFSPLASRSFTRRKKKANLEETMQNCVDILQKDLNNKGIRCFVPTTKTIVAVDPGELEAVLLNLLTNAIYWLGKTPREERKINFKNTIINGGKRVRVWVHDSGEGIDNDVVDKIFLPGVTRRPNGIGMGLTVASEIVGEYGGSVFAKKAGTLGGASIGFDLPVAKREGA